MADPRYIAVKLLTKTFRSGSYSNIQLSAGLDSSGLDDRGKKLCSAVYYGVIQRMISLDYVIGKLSSRPVSKMDDEIVNILRCGIYQLAYMDSIPDNAAVNESVALAKSSARQVQREWSMQYSAILSEMARAFMRETSRVLRGCR